MSFNSSTHGGVGRGRNKRGSGNGDGKHGGARIGAGRPRVHTDPKAAHAERSRLHYAQKTEAKRKALADVDELRADLHDMKQLNRKLLDNLNRQSERDVETIQELEESNRNLLVKLARFERQVNEADFERAYNNTTTSMINEQLRMANNELTRLRQTLQQAQTARNNDDGEIAQLREDLEQVKKAKKAKENQLIEAQKTIGALKIEIIKLSDVEENVDASDSEIMASEERRQYHDRQNLTLGENLQRLPQGRPRRPVLRFKPASKKK